MQFLNKSGFLAGIVWFLSSMKLGTSASYFNKKCDEFGQIYNEKLCEDKLSDEKVMKKSVEPLSHVDKETTTDHAFAVIAPCGHVESQPTTKHSECVNPADSPDKENMLSPGCKYVIDNFDLYQKVRTMTQSNQNVDIHWVNHNRIINRVSGNHLSDNMPTHDILQLESAKIIPSANEHMLQRSNYITLIERILVSSIPCLKFREDVAINKRSILPPRRKFALSREGGGRKVVRCPDGGVAS